MALASPAAGAEDAERIRRIFAVLDVPAELAAVAPVASVQLAGAPAADRAALRRILREGFAAPRLERLAAQAFRARLLREDARAREAEAWLARPGIQRLYAAGRPGGAPCANRAEDLRGVRGGALARIRAATHAGARARSHALRTYRVLLLAANAALPETRRYGPGELRQRIAAQRRALRPRSVGEACRYRAFPTATLRAAQAFLENDAGRWLHASVSAAVEEALARAAHDTVRRIVEHFGDPGLRVPVRIARATAPDPGRGP